MSKVLVIDDDPDYSDMLRYRLEAMGHEASGASCLRDGLGVAQSLEPDVVFLDVSLPDGSGLAAIGRVAESPGSPEVIIITGRGDPEGAEIAVRSGAWDYVCKGDPAQQVVLALRRALEYRAQRQAVRPRALDLGGMIGQSSAMKASFDSLAQAASTDANVLLSGESGTGKELFAWAIHRNSKRSRGNFVVVDCAALPANLVESVLFGHRKGAFTGAVENRVGLVEQADGGTLFLDEVAEMPLALQKPFLRVLQEKAFRPIGADRETRSDFRLIAATNRNPDQMVRDGLFREDLLFRLRAVRVHLPPLRERGDDLREIAKDAVARICDREGIGTKGISPEFYETLGRYPWPGNVRELVQALEHAVGAAIHYHTLYPKHLPTEVRVHAVRSGVEATTPEPEPPPLPTGCSSLLPAFRQSQEEAAKAYLTRLMAETGGDIEQACRLSQVSRAALYSLLKRHNIPRKP